MKIGDLVIYRSAMDTVPFRGIVVDHLPGINIRYGFESEYIFINSELVKIHWLCPPDLGPELAVQKFDKIKPRNKPARIYKRVDEAHILNIDGILLRILK